MEVIKYNYEPELKNEFIELNKAWIIRDYVLEDEDIKVFNTIDEKVKNGSIIYFVKNENIIVSTLMLEKLSNTKYELIKFATKEGYYNLGAGSFLLDYVIKDIANCAKEIVIATNKKCIAAIHLYEKYGFKKTNLLQYGFSSNRVDICYKLELGGIYDK